MAWMLLAMFHYRITRQRLILPEGLAGKRSALYDCACQAAAAQWPHAQICMRTTARSCGLGGSVCRIAYQVDTILEVRVILCLDHLTTVVSIPAQLRVMKRVQHNVVSYDARNPDQRDCGAYLDHTKHQ